MQAWISVIAICIWLQVAGCASDTFRSAGNFEVSVKDGECSCDVNSTTVTGGPSVELISDEMGCTCDVKHGAAVLDGFDKYLEAMRGL